jgi:hypothetical protein
MKNLARFLVAVALIFTFVFCSLPEAKACGPFTINPVFSLSKHADFPLSDFASGKVGIIMPAYGRASLYVFYRYLNNLSATKNEQKQIVDALENRIGFYRGEYSKYEQNVPDYYAEWKAARAKIISDETKIETEKLVPGDYNYFSNCLPDAFHNATKTLEARISKYGNGEPVKEWISGQDTVFLACEKAETEPKQLDENAPEWLKQDRKYQIAAAKFYLGDFPSARSLFEQIEADTNSVWKNAAKFVIARTFIRQASFIEAGDDESKAEKSNLLKKAATQLETILADDSMKDFHSSANRLLGLVKYRSIPTERQKELAEILAKPAENQNIYNDLVDYSWLLDYAENKAIDKGAEIETKKAEAENKPIEYDYELRISNFTPSELENDLTDWIFTYQAKDGFQHAFDKWKETGKLEWFVASLVKADSKTLQTSEILSEADKIQPNSPAFATVRYNQIRLLLESGKRAEAKKLLDQILSAQITKLPRSAQNDFFAQKMIVAENLEEFLKFAQRKASIFVWSDDGNEQGADLSDVKELSKWTERAMFDTDAVAFFNEKMPLQVLRQAALSSQLPEYLKKFLVTAVWTRAFVLGNKEIEREFTPLMLRYAKEYSPLFSKYAGASNPANRDAAALIALLRYPILQPYVPVGFGRGETEVRSIDSIRGNWWCAETENGEDKSFYDLYPFEYPKAYPDFLSAAEKSSAEREHKQLIALGNSATFFARRALEFASKNPNHPQTPEILHLAVRSTRYGCTDNDTGKLSKEAFDILHKRFAKSAWTKETPYWFGSDGTEEN